MNVAVTSYQWEEDGFFTVNFAVFKKGLFGGMKPDRRFHGWYLAGKVEDGKLNPQYILIHDGNLQPQPQFPELIMAVLDAACFTLFEDDEGEKAKILKNGRQRFLESVTGNE